MSLTVTQISPDLYQFNESTNYGLGGEPQPYVDAYLYLGSDRAAVIDTLQNEPGLYAAVREITQLPVDVLITHGHFDHVGVSAKDFLAAGCKLYMSGLDIPVLKDMNAPVPLDSFTELEGIERFELGGKSLEVLSCGGHTPGSKVFLDREHGVAFSGDTVGSGAFWLQLPTCLPLRQFEDNLRRMLKALEGLDLDKLLVYPGHRNQSPVQLTGQYFVDAAVLGEKLLSGEVVGQDQVLDMAGRHMEYKSAALGMMRSFCYDPHRLG